MTPALDMVATNLGIYQRPATAQWYATLSGLTAAEQAAFELTARAWREGDVLDIGIGGGRTCEPLSREARSYVGVDYSPAMVAAARARYPRLDLRQADIRDLSALGEARFDWAFFADNGIDAVDDEGRARALREVRRVLRPGGTFVLNSHNLDCAENHWGEMLRVEFSASPLRTLKSVARIGVRMKNWLSSAGHRRRTDRYVIKQDPGNNFASPHYYCTGAEMRRQLAAAGFELDAVLDIDGRRVGETPQRHSPTLYYIVRRPLAC